MSGLEHYRMLIDGRWVGAEDGGSFESLNPATGAAWATIPEATADDVDRAVQAAHRAFTEGPWAKFTPTERGRSLRRLADLLAEKSEELGRTETIDSGKMLKETRWQAKYIAEFFHYYAGCADKIHGDTMPIDKPDLCVFTLREPLGVVAAVVPWNSQLFLVAVKIGPALAAGNTVVLKASEQASAAMLEFGKLIEAAGIPPGVVNIVTGHGEPCGKVLTSHPLVQRISFTGGPQAARHVLHNSAENFAEVSLELGGKSPFLVFEDADIESAVNGSIAGIFGATGVKDFAGGIVVHETAGIAALVIAWFLGPRRHRTTPPHSPGFVMIGAGMLWVGWFGFNGGSQLAADGGAAMALTVTHISAAAASLSWALWEKIKYGTASLVGLVTGTIAGLASITPASGFVGPVEALVIGTVAGILCQEAVNLIRDRIGIDDTLDVFAVHGVGGIFGTLMIAAFGAGAWGAQLGALAIVGVFTLVVSTVLLKLVALVTPLRVDHETEVNGLDLAVHGERAYDFTS